MSDVSFDGINKIITVASGITSIDIQDVYSRWKDWTQVSDNLKYPKAFSVVGGDPTITDQYITPYYFLENQWRMRPYEGNHTLEVNGIVLTIEGGGTQPFLHTLGDYNVSIRSIVPIRTETVVSNDVEGLASTILDAEDGIETNVTLKEALRVILSVLAGKTSIVEGTPTQMKFRDVNDTKWRLIADVEDSERTSVNLDTS